MSNKSKTCSLKLQGSNGRELVGTAAQLHLISRSGGWNEFMKKLGAEIGQAVAVKMVDTLTAQVLSSLPLTEMPSLPQRRMEVRVSPVTVNESTRHVH